MFNKINTFFENREKAGVIVGGIIGVAGVYTIAYKMGVAMGTLISAAWEHVS